MKRILITMALLAITLSTYAQRGIPRTDQVSVSSTIVTKTKTRRVLKKYDAEKGFQHMVEAGTKFDLSGEDKGRTGVNYIFGYRFNNWFLAGIGAGIEYSHHTNSEIKEYIGKNATTYTKYRYGGVYSSEICNALGIKEADEYSQSLSRIAVPLYIHMRGYYMRTRWAPYSSLSAGGIFAPKENGAYLDFSTGVDFRMHKDAAKTNSPHLYMSIGFWLRGGVVESRYSHNDFVKTSFDRYEDCGDENCPIKIQTDNYYGHYHYECTNLWPYKCACYGVSARIGFSF